LNPIWILCNARSGSSILCEYLNNLNIFEVFEHEEIEKRNAHLLKTKGAFNEFLRLYNTLNELILNPPRYLKCLDEQYIQLIQKNLNYDAVFIRKILPGIKFIKLKRKDNISQAISLYCARLTNKWHIYTEEELKNYHQIEISFNPKLALECLYEIENYHNWSWFIKDDFLEVFYEDLLIEPQNIIRKILDFSQVDADNQVIYHSIETTKKRQRIYKMTRNEDLMRFFKSLKIKL
jgi:LPS sulfotransferase NodH